MQHVLSTLLASSLAVFFVTSSAYAEPPRLLFDGVSLNGWTLLSGQPVSDAWEAVDGTLHLKPGRSGGANIVTDREYRDFELSFEWKIKAGGNNGLKYRVRRYGDQYLGCEYQMLDDDAYRTELKPRGMTGSLYEVYEPLDTKQLRPVGEFNHSRIVVRGQHVEHWLNGQRIVAAEVGSPDWFERVAASKFSDVEGFGLNRDGKIMLTDHSSEVWYRNIVLTPLEETYLVARGTTYGSRSMSRCALGRRVFVRPPRRIDACRFVRRFRG